MASHDDSCSVKLQIDADQTSDYPPERSRTSLWRKLWGKLCPGQNSFHRLRHEIGMLMGVMAGMFLAFGIEASHHMASIGPVQATAHKFFTVAFIMWILLWVFMPEQRKGNEFPTNGKMALLSLVLAAKFGAFAFGNNELSGPEFSLIVNTVPIYTALASWLVLGEPVTREKAVACVVATVGIFTVCVPGAFESKEDNHWPWLQLSAGATTAVSASVNALALYILRDFGTINAMWVTFNASLVTAIGATVGATFSGGLVFPAVGDVVLVFFAACCTLLKLYLPALACALTDPSIVALSLTTAVPLPFALAALARGKSSPPLAFLGGFLVVVAMIIASVPKSFPGTDPDEKTALIEGGDVPWTRHGAVALIGSPECGKLCANVRLIP